MLADIAGTPAVFDIDSLFDRVRAEKLSDGHWDAVDAPAADGISLFSRSDSPGFIRLRTEYDLPAALDFVMKVVRPEVFFHHRRPDSNPKLSECQLGNVFNPGDAEGLLRFHESQSRIASIVRMALLYGNSEECQRAWRENGSDAFFASRRMRLTMRRDFPEQGQCAVVDVPCDYESGELREEYGDRRSTAGLFEEAGPHRTKVTEIKILPAGSAWSLSFVDGSSVAEAIFLQYFTRCLPFTESQAWRTLVDSMWGYIVITLRTCAKGPPMLPQASGGDLYPGSGAADGLSWVQVEKYELPRYLTTFLAELGVYVDVFEQIDGQQLVHYQAALRRDDWERARAALEVPWKVMKANYRRQLGGTYAPELSSDKPPRFVTRSRQIRQTQELEARPVPARQTFVHFSVHSGQPARPRSESTSVLDCAHAASDAGLLFVPHASPVPHVAHDGVDDAELPVNE